MKTSIFVSSIAAFFLMITFGGTPKQNAENETITGLLENFPSQPAFFQSSLHSDNYATENKEESNTIVSPSMAEDFSYLKFRVADYVLPYSAYDESGTGLTALTTDFGYLKFDASKYSNNSELTENEYPELPESENLINNTTPKDPAITGFEYLKFDVNNYVANSEEESTEIYELHANEFDYLKFNVNKFYTEDSLNSGAGVEIPFASE